MVTVFIRVKFFILCTFSISNEIKVLITIRSNYVWLGFYGHHFLVVCIYLIHQWTKHEYKLNNISQDYDHYYISGCIYGGCGM